MPPQSGGVSGHLHCPDVHQDVPTDRRTTLLIYGAALHHPHRKQKPSSQATAVARLAASRSWRRLSPGVVPLRVVPLCLFPIPAFAEVGEVSSLRSDSLNPVRSSLFEDSSQQRMKEAALQKIAPSWMNISLAMKMDPETDKSFGWVLEMYAYAVASALHGVKNILYKDFMIQPPWDTEVGNKYIIHYTAYTYGCDYDMKGKLTYGKIGEWRFDKRSYTYVKPPRNLPLPPPGVSESVVTLVKMVNEATSNIPNWED